MSAMDQNLVYVYSALDKKELSTYGSECLPWIRA